VESILPRGSSIATSERTVPLADRPVQTRRRSTRESGSQLEVSVPTTPPSKRIARQMNPTEGERGAIAKNLDVNLSKGEHSQSTLGDHANGDSHRSRTSALFVAECVKHHVKVRHDVSERFQSPLSRRGWPPSTTKRRISSTLGFESCSVRSTNRWQA
jgi:hypothetical protein